MRVTLASFSNLHFARRCWSTSNSAAASSSAKPASAVNVEEFTLNDEVVQRDMDNMAKWNHLSAEVDAARAAADHQRLLEHVAKGLTMLEEMGAANAPIQCECLLCMEASQAHYNLGQYDDALRFAERARGSLLQGAKPELQDKAQIAEIEVFMGFTLCQQGEGAEAQELLQKVLHWIDVDAKSAMPLQAVAAVNLRRSVLTGIGRSITLQATDLAKKGETAEAKELYSKALDSLIEALNQHIDENDFNLVKSTLQSILTCFEGLGDVAQAVTTCRKYVSWCRRHDDAAGVAEGEAMMADLCARHNVENPLEAEKEEK
jgi:tetratricopeptide (TPR) repeat protein